jgi:hypothetical protein
MNTDSKTPNLVYAYFYLRGDGVELNTITQILGVNSSWQFTNGESYGVKKDKIRETNLWYISSDDQIESEKAGHHLEWILNQLEPIFPQLETILADDNVKADINVVFHLKTLEWGHDISPSIIQRIANINIPLSFSFHSLGLTVG